MPERANSKNTNQSEKQPAVFTGRFTQRDFEEGKKLRDTILQLADEAEKESALQRAGVA